MMIATPSIWQQFLEHFTAGKLQRSPITGKMQKRHNGKWRTNSATSTGCGCIKTCSCSAGTAPCTIQAEFSGISLCSCTSDGQAAFVSYTGTVPTTPMCCDQAPCSGGCVWEIILPPEAHDVRGTKYTDSACANPASGGTVGPLTHLRVFINRSAATWIVELRAVQSSTEGWCTATRDDAIIFRGESTTLASGVCTGTWTISNTVLPAPCPTGNGGTVTITTHTCTA